MSYRDCAPAVGVHKPTQRIVDSDRRCRRRERGVGAARTVCCRRRRRSRALDEGRSRQSASVSHYTFGFSLYMLFLNIHFVSNCT